MSVRKGSGKGKAGGKGYDRHLGLRLAEWNAAAYDTHGYEKSRNPRDAAKYFRSTSHAVVVCPENDAHNEAAFEREGYSMVKARGPGNIVIFYDRDVLTRADDPVKQTLPANDHGGVMMGVSFKMGNSRVLVTAVHTGHYGEPSHPDKAAASSALKMLHTFQKERGAAHFDTVIVAGDLNELGQLIHNDPDIWGPLPPDVENQHRSAVGKTCVTARMNGMFDHIWAGGKGIHGHPSSRMGDAFGSDHHSVSMWLELSSRR